MRLVLGLRQQLSHRLIEDRMDPERIEFIHRHEDESALMETRMRNGQPWFLDHTLPIKEDVQVDRARTGPIVFISVQRALDFLEGREEAAWSNVRFKLHHPIEKPSFPGIDPVADRFCFIQQRDALQARMWEEAEQRHRSIAKIDSIADVRSESDEDGLTHERIS